MKLTQIVLLGATVVVAAQPHRHAHLHEKKHASPVDKRADVTRVVPGPEVTVYELNGVAISGDKVNQGIKDGIYILISEEPKPTTTARPSTKAAEFFQKTTTTSSVVSIPTTTTTPPAPSTTPSTTSAPPPPPTTTTTPSAAPTSSKAAATSSASSGGSTSGGQGVTSQFPSGSIPCSTFPSSYGAVAVDWLNMGGWIGIQKTPNYSPGSAAISFIETAISGQNCGPGMFCSYACPAGYQKSQWPSAQGSTGQSIGGLYCNSNGKLEISNTNYNTLCIAGTGGVQVVNKLGTNAAICRTDYPGTESETVPLNTQPGQTYPLTCPDANTYYSWQGGATSAQYYINNAGVSVSDACQWGTAGSNMGNWAPMNLGVGKGTSGGTYISMFPNTPTNDLSVKLDFNVAITGGITGDCKYVDGVYYNNGSPSDHGCTVFVTGTAVFELTPRGS